MGSRAALAFLGLGALAVLLRAAAAAWVAEDALISFRTIDNFVAGYGLRWNVDERVQVYTHPLWLGLNALGYAFTREVPYTTTAIGLACTTLAWVVAARRLLAESLQGAGVVLAALLLSPSVVRYATSGFETPLAFLLLAGFAVALFPREGQATRWGALSLCAALVVTNRLDHVLLVAPPAAFACASAWRDVHWRRVALGALPLAVWLGFATLYYGSPLPNTGRAKLSDEIPLSLYVREGLHYAADLVQRDPLGAALLAAALGVAAGCAVRVAADPRDVRAGRCAAFGVGVLVYGLYVIRVGGGFLSGRFFAAPILAAALVVAFGRAPLARQWQRARAPLATAFAAVAAALLVGGIFAATRLERPPRGPIHERSLAHWRLQPDLSWQRTRTASNFIAIAYVLQRQALAGDGRAVGVHGTVGFAGYFAGPRITIIDSNALADPLLARLPLDPGARWKIGHLQRVVPEGYVEARRSGDATRMHPALRRYYEHLRLVVSGPLFDPERLRTLVALHLGRYEPLLAEWREARREAGR